MQDKIKYTKDNGILIECKLLGDGSEENPYRPEVFDNYDGYYHLNKKDIDYTNKTVKIWVSKKKSKPATITAIKADNKLTKIKETTNGGVIG